MKIMSTLRPGDISPSKLLKEACVTGVKCPTILFLMMIALVTFAEAQRCGRWNIEVEVQTTAGEPLESAVVELLPISADERRGKRFANTTGSPSKFKIEFLEGHSIENFHRLLVTADGHKPAELEMRASSCESRELSVSLPKTDVHITPVWGFVNRINVRAKDTNGKNLSAFKLKVMLDDDGFRSEFFEYYGGSITLPNGAYVFRFEKEGYESQEVEVDASKLSDLEIIAKLKEKTTKQK